jgi:hypothetical protein
MPHRVSEMLQAPQLQMRDAILDYTIPIMLNAIGGVCVRYRAAGRMASARCRPSRL